MKAFAVGDVRYPILNAYLASRSRVSIIDGPLGSGKTTASCARILMHQMEQEPNAEGIRWTRILVVRNCYSADTEILTEARGWVRFDELGEGERVAMLGTSGAMEWAAPSYYYRAPYHGEMLGYEGEGVDFLVTPDHRMWVSKLYGRAQQWQPFGMKLASEVYERHGIAVQRDAAPWVGHSEHSPAFFRWLGLWFAEGTSGIYDYGAEQRWQCVITQCRNLEPVHRAFRDAELPYSVSVRTDGGRTFRLRTTPRTRWLIAKLAESGHSKTKHLPPWIKDAPAEHLSEFIEGFLDGDGHRRGASAFAYTSSRRLADDLQELALKCGRVANIHSRDRSNDERLASFRPTGPEYTVSFVTEQKYRPRLWHRGMKQHTARTRGWYREQYQGSVYCLEVPTHVVYVRRNGKAFWCCQTYPDLLSTTAETFKAFFFPEEVSGQTEDPREGLPKLPVLGRWYGGGAEPPQAVFDYKLEDGTVCKSQVVFRALDRPGDVRSILGSEFTWIYLSECKELDKSIVDMLTKRHGRYPSPAQGGVPANLHGIFGDTNKCNRGHWLYEAAEKQHPEGWTFFQQPGGLLEDESGRDALGRKKWRANPEAENLANLPADYYTADLATYREDWISVYLANEYGYVATGKAVHPDYVDHVHCAREPLAAVPGEWLVVGYDFGRTPAAVVCQWWPGIGRWAALAEYVTYDTSAATFAPDFKLWLARGFPEFVRHGAICGWGDPAGDQLGQADDETPIKILNSHGLPCKAAPTQDPLLRRSALANPLRRGTMDGGRGFVVSPACEVLRQGLQGGWCYERVQKTGAEEYRDTPAKNRFSHVCFVAGTPISTPAGPRPIESLCVGDLVETPIGQRRVVFVGSREASVRRYRSSDGRSVTCTPDHPFLAAPGEWIPATEAVEYGVSLLTEESPPWILSRCLRAAQRRSIRSSSSPGDASTGGAPTTRTLTTSGFIGSSGWLQTARFLWAMTSTIETAIASTIGSGISRAWRSPSITESTCALPAESKARGGPSGSPSVPLCSGAGSIRSSRARSAERARRQLGRLWPLVPAGWSPVFTAALYSRPRIQRPGCVREPASRLDVARPGLMTFLLAAQSAAVGFVRTATGLGRLARLVAESSPARARVFSLEVEDAHSYFAGGLLASNCEALEYALSGEGESVKAIQPASSRFGLDDGPGQEYAEME